MGESSRRLALRGYLAVLGIAGVFTVGSFALMERLGMVQIPLPRLLGMI